MFDSVNMAYSGKDSIFDSLFTVVAKLYFVNDEVRAGCPKLGHLYPSYRTVVR